MTDYRLQAAVAALAPKSTPQIFGRHDSLTYKPVGKEARVFIE
jgi:hypothetical protein